MKRLMALFALVAAWLLVGTAVAGEQIRFVKTQLDPLFRSEGVAVGDFNGDGQKDIAAGQVWYAAPDWEMYPIAERIQEYDPKGYSNSFVNAVLDVNHDGWLDLMVVDFPGTPTWWFENPGAKTRSEGDGESAFERPWAQHLVTPVTNNESPQFVDFDGDGRPEWLMGVAPSSEQADGPERRLAFLTPADDPLAPWSIHGISQPGQPGSRRYDHGLGFGDINGDGRNDVLVAQGWYEAPARPGPWPFHPVDFGGPCAHMYVYDFDGDGDADVLNSSAHAFGIWWHEQVGPDQWKTHLIDDSFSQTHALVVADINGDGLPDFVTGKRWWAHASGDPGGDQPAVFFWFELKRENGRPQWIPHQFDHDSGPGTQFEVTDVDGDGLLDVVSSNKKGVYWFRQVWGDSADGAE